MNRILVIIHHTAATKTETIIHEHYLQIQIFSQSFMLQITFFDFRNLSICNMAVFQGQRALLLFIRF